MRDSDVRPALVHAVARRSDGRPALLVPEVDIRWSIPARLDALLVGDRICGFEIKSDVDSLSRLPRQVQAYGPVVERAVLVVGPRHRAAATALVPDWWSVWAALWKNDAVKIRLVRRGRPNPSPSPLAVTSFMTRDDLTAVLRERGHLRLSALTVDELRLRLVAEFGPRQTLRVARAAMLARPDWQARSLFDVGPTTGTLRNQRRSS